VHNIELQPGKGGQLVRAAGGAAQLVAKEGQYAQVRLPSGEVRLISQNCLATVGQIGNLDHNNITIGKAGRKRWARYSPNRSRHGDGPEQPSPRGGEGRAPVGMPGPKTPWANRPWGPRLAAINAPRSTSCAVATINGKGGLDHDAFV